MASENDASCIDLRLIQYLELKYSYFYSGFLGNENSNLNSYLITGNFQQNRWALVKYVLLILPALNLSDEKSLSCNLNWFSILWKLGISADLLAVRWWVGVLS